MLNFLKEKIIQNTLTCVIFFWQPLHVARLVVEYLILNSSLEFIFVIFIVGLFTGGTLPAKDYEVVSLSLRYNEIKFGPFLMQTSQRAPKYKFIWCQSVASDLDVFIILNLEQTKTVIKHQESTLSVGLHIGATYLGATPRPVASSSVNYESLTSMASCS